MDCKWAVLARCQQWMRGNQRKKPPLLHGAFLKWEYSVHLRTPQNGFCMVGLQFGQSPIEPADDDWGLRGYPKMTSWKLPHQLQNSNSPEHRSEFLSHLSSNVAGKSTRKDAFMGKVIHKWVVVVDFSRHKHPKPGWVFPSHGLTTFQVCASRNVALPYSGEPPQGRLKERVSLGRIIQLGDGANLNDFQSGHVIIRMINHQALHDGWLIIHLGPCA